MKTFCKNLFCLNRSQKHFLQKNTILRGIYLPKTSSSGFPWKSYFVEQPSSPPMGMRRTVLANLQGGRGRGAAWSLLIRGVQCCHVFPSNLCFGDVIPQPVIKLHLCQLPSKWASKRGFGCSSNIAHFSHTLPFIAPLCYSSIFVWGRWTAAVYSQLGDWYALERAPVLRTLDFLNIY